ncbi:MAG: Uma2 family endonuclease [Pyrinomonadaceae bacterium]
MSFTITKPVTAAELLAMPDDGFRYELVKGELIRVPPPGHEHGRVAMNIAGPLYQHVMSNNLGEVYAAETGFLIHQNPDTVRAPDSAFIRRERLEGLGPIEGYWVGAPDLCVEVVSPSDSVGYVEEKVTEWIAAGSRLVWVVSPKLKTVTVYKSLAEIVTLTENDMLDGADVVPGFRLAVVEIF